MATKFQIMRMETIGTPPLMMGGRVWTFDDPEEANQTARRMARELGEKLCVKPIVDSKWRAREQRRYDNNEYRYLPWELTGANWWRSDAAYAIRKDHYPHASLEKPGFIAYTKSEEDGTKDKQTLLRPGAYLSRYFQAVLNDYGLSEQRLVDEFMKMYGPVEVKFAETEQDIVKVYNNGPQTCLHKDKRYPKNIHPASVYAAGDLQIAYLGNIDGKVTARTVVWPKKKIYSRVYGDIARLTQGLERLGYRWGAPVGAKLKRIQLRKVDLNDGQPQGCFLVPYLDKKNQQGGGHLAVIDKEDHLVICMEGELGSHHAGGPDGKSGLYVPREDERPRYVCARCEEAVEEGLYSIYCDPEDDTATESWCGECTAARAVQCHWSGDFYTNDFDMVLVDGVTWLESNADMYAVRCEGNGKLYHKDHTRTVYFPDGTSKVFSNVYSQGLGGLFMSQLTNRNYFRAEKAYVYSNFDRYLCAKSELTRRAFQCDGCDNFHLLEERRQSLGDDRLFCPTCDRLTKDIGEVPISKSRKRFEENLKQKSFRLEAAE